MMCDFNQEDECQHAAAAEREIILEQLRQLMQNNKEKLSHTTGVTRSIRLMGTIIGLEDAIKLIESLEE